MRYDDAAVVDFETKKIDSRPSYPPKPVGVAIKWPGGKSEYLAWGHPHGNNCEVSTARAKLKDAYRAKQVIFHNSSFDMDVAECHMGLAPPRRFEDTLYLSFLKNPYEETLSLKPMSEKYLDMPPEEQEDLKDWILANVPEAKRKKTKWGEYISEAPVSKVAPYAIGDVERTHGLFAKFMPEIEKRGMLEAYVREIKCTPITLEMERSGIRIDVRRLKKCLRVFETMDADIMARLRKKLRVGPEFNLNSSQQLGDALIRMDKLDSIIKTPTGLVSTKITNLKQTCSDKELLNLLSVHSVCEKYITSFMRPWLEQAARTGGRLLPTFNQVRSRGEYTGGGGARSGRYSSSDPNMQQVAGNPEESQNKEVLMMMQQWLLKDYHFKFRGLRDYIIPDEDCVMICVDYNQQELRILAHFEKDVLMKAYLANPKMDIHEFCRQLVFKATGVLYERKHIKVTVFGIVYGMGVAKLADRLEVDEKTARGVKNGILTAVPGIGRIVNEMKRLANHDEPLVTWGGRQYFCEEPRYDEKKEQWQSFEYKMLNYLVQPSAADCTKQGMINVNEQVPDVRIALQVHDELVCMAKSRDFGPRITRAMTDVKFRVPMLADAKYSTTSWARAA